MKREYTYDLEKIETKALAVINEMTSYAHFQAGKQRNPEHNKNYKNSYMLAHLTARQLSVKANTEELVITNDRFSVSLPLSKWKNSNRVEAHESRIWTALVKLNIMISADNYMWMDQMYSEFMHSIDASDPLFNDAQDRFYSTIFGLSVDNLRSGYKAQRIRLLSIHHPDKGGESIFFDALMGMCEEFDLTLKIEAAFAGA